LKAGIFIVDVELGAFIDYRDGTVSRDELWDGTIKTWAERPWPKSFRKDTWDEGSLAIQGPVSESKPRPEILGTAIHERLGYARLLIGFLPHSETLERVYQRGKCRAKLVSGC
jgi:hypothetical protein